MNKLGYHVYQGIEKGKNFLPAPMFFKWNETRRDMKWLMITLMSLTGTAIMAQNNCRTGYEGAPNYQRLPNQKVYWPFEQNSMHNGPDYQTDPLDVASQQYASKHYFQRFEDELPPFESQERRGYSKFDDYIADENAYDPMNLPGNPSPMSDEDYTVMQVYYPDRFGFKSVADYDLPEYLNNENGDELVMQEKQEYVITPDRNGYGVDVNENPAEDHYLYDYSLDENVCPVNDVNEPEGTSDEGM